MKNKKVSNLFDDNDDHDQMFPHKNLLLPLVTPFNMDFARSQPLALPNQLNPLRFHSDRAIRDVDGARSSIFILTWNVSGVSPEKYEPDIIPLFKRIQKYKPEVLVVGLQEIIELKMKYKNIKGYMNVEDISQSWQAVFKRNLPEYTFVFNKTLIGLESFVFVRGDYDHQLVRVEDWLVKLGVMNVGNKGSISFAVSFRDHLLSFCNCHLSAGNEEKHNRARSEDLQQIISQLEKVKANSAFSYSFLFGDMNFKLKGLSKSQLRDVLQNRAVFSGIRQTDEWVSLSQNNYLLGMWKEAEIFFPPTYKFKRKTLQYKIKEGKSPAWTDRIFLKKENAQLDIIEYASLLIPVSDHMPVYLFGKLFN